MKGAFTVFAMGALAMGSDAQADTTFEDLFYDCGVWIDASISVDGDPEPRRVEVEGFGNVTLTLTSDVEQGGQLCQIRAFFWNDDQPDLFYAQGAVFEQWTRFSEAISEEFNEGQNNDGIAAVYYTCTSEGPRVKAAYGVQRLHEGDGFSATAKELFGGDSMIQFIREEPGRLAPQMEIDGKPVTC